jgi:hypothetical protein
MAIANKMAAITSMNWGELCMIGFSREAARPSHYL